jgi:hypothetical protein
MREPDVTGPAGKAWIMTAAASQPDHQAHLESWLLQVPGAHPLWQHWVMALVHLRDVPGVKPAHRQYPEAEHELLILSLDPGHPANPDLAAGERLHFLTPPDLVHQFHGLTDDRARQLGTMAVRAICNGHLSPDQDFRSVWRTVIDATVAHYRQGAHLPG